jgi:hypothetical protein
MLIVEFEPHHLPISQRLRQEGKQLDRMVRDRVDEVAENLEQFIGYKKDNI